MELRPGLTEPVILKDDYVRFVRKLYRVMIDNDTFDDIEATTYARQDWERDSKNEGYVTRERFGDVVRAAAAARTLLRPWAPRGRRTRNRSLALVAAEATIIRMVCGLPTIPRRVMLIRAAGRCAGGGAASAAGGRGRCSPRAGLTSSSGCAFQRTAASRRRRRSVSGSERRHAPLW